MLKGIDIWEEKLPNQLCSIAKLPEAAKTSKKKAIWKKPISVLRHFSIRLQTEN